MPTNKNAITRYALIDRILANQNSSYSIQDITDLLAEKLVELGYEPVSKRCVEKDLNYLQYESPFNVEIEEYWIDFPDKNDRPYRKRCIRYADPTFSIFKPKLSDDEKTVLATALDTIGSFDGLDNFEWLNDLRKRLNIVDRTPVISISKNLLNNSTLIARLFTSIRLNQVIKLEYQTFDLKDSRQTEIIPRLLKEYNNRWFLIASACDTGKILTFSLDRIKTFCEIHNRSYVSCLDDLDERFEEIVGVTFREECPLEKITFWVSDNSKEYLKTKPIHGSQVLLGTKKENELRKLYPWFIGGSFFQLECRRNYELIRELTSFGPELIVLSPRHITEIIRQNLEKMNTLYREVLDNYNGTECNVL